MRRFTKLQKRPTAGRGVTYEHDRQQIYRKRTMSFRRKRRWRRFKRRVKAVAEKDLGSRTVVFNRATTFENTTDGNQIIGSMAIYPLKSSLSTWMNDLKTLSNLENLGDQTALEGGTVTDSTKFLFQSAVLDVTLRNTSDKNDENLNPDATLEVDIYEITSRRQFYDSATAAYEDLQNAFLVGSNRTGKLDNTGTSCDLFLRGCTPWDLPHSLSSLKAKIWKKTKFFIRSGQTCTYQYRDPKRHVMTFDYMNNKPGCNVPGLTKFIFVIAKSVPGIEVGTIAGTKTRERLRVGITRKYFYKVEGFNEARDRYLAGT